MTNPFTQHIGIWYAKEDEQMMMRIMDQISDWCSGYIEKEIHSKYERVIYLKDGTWIRGIPATTNMRGQRCSTSFIINPEHINEEIINCVIRPITIAGSGDVCVIDSSDKEELWYRLWYRIGYNYWREQYIK